MEQVKGGFLPERKRLADTIREKRAKMFEQLAEFDRAIDRYDEYEEDLRRAGVLTEDKIAQRNEVLGGMRDQRRGLKEKMQEQIRLEIAGELEQLESRLKFKTETAVVLKNRSEGKEAKKDTVALALAFGAPRHILPNWVIQERTKLYDPHNVFTDVASPSPTPLTVGPAVKHMKEHGLKKVTIIAEPTHAKRVQRDLLELAKREGLEVEVEYDDFLSHLSPDTWHSEESTQFWTRNVAMWRVYEFLVNRIPFDAYLKMAQNEKDTNRRGLSSLKTLIE